MFLVGPETDLFVIFLIFAGMFCVVIVAFSDLSGVWLFLNTLTVFFLVFVFDVL